MSAALTCALHRAFVVCAKEQNAMSGIHQKPISEVTLIKYSFFIVDKWNVPTEQ